MQTKIIKRTFSSVGQCLLTAVLSMIVVLALGDILGDVFPLSEELGEALLYTAWGIILAAACYFICKRNPTSIWYAPILCNVIGIIAAIIEPNFWITPMWIFICGGWVLSIIAAISGRKAGKETLV